MISTTFDENIIILLQFTGSWSCYKYRNKVPSALYEKFE